MNATLETVIGELDLPEHTTLGELIDVLVTAKRDQDLTLKAIRDKFDEHNRGYDTNNLPESIGQLFRSWQSFKDKAESATKKLVEQQREVAEGLAPLRAALGLPEGTGVSPIPAAVQRIQESDAAFRGVRDAISALNTLVKCPENSTASDVLTAAAKRITLLQETVAKLGEEQNDAAEAMFEIARSCGYSSAEPFSVVACRAAITAELKRLRTISSTDAQALAFYSWACETASALGLSLAQLQDKLKDTKKKLICGCPPGGYELPLGHLLTTQKVGSTDYRYAEQILDALEGLEFEGLSFGSNLLPERIKVMVKHLRLNAGATDSSRALALTIYLMENYELC
jgi:hypothetical protein